MRKLTPYFSAIVGDVAERLDHDVLEPLVDLALAPEEARAVLHPLEVGHRHAAGVGQDVRHDEDVLRVQDLVGALRRRAVGALDDDLRLDVAGVLLADLVLVGGRDEDVAVELEQVLVADGLGAREALERLVLLVVGEQGRHVDAALDVDAAVDVGDGEDLRARPRSTSAPRSSRRCRSPARRSGCPAASRPRRGAASRAMSMRPRPVASTRPREPPSERGLPVTTEVTVWRACME